MSSKDKTRRATAAADSALTAARKAAKLSKTLPDKQATKLAPLIKDAKKAGTVTKKQLEDRPRRIERAATEAILALADATAKAEQRRAKKADAKKADAKKADAKNSAAKKSDAKKSARKKRSAPVPAVPSPAVMTDSPRSAGTTVETLATPNVLQNLTVAALRARAKAEGRVGYSRLSKAELIALFV